jgi:flagellar motility protein MotE (MotC chaperone)
MSENLSNFANDFDDDPVGGLAYTDFSKPMPVLEGEDAERFVRMMEENEKKAKERAKRPKTKAEIESELSIKKMILDYELREIENLKKDIEKLEKLHAKAKEE